MPSSISGPSILTKEQYILYVYAYMPLSKQCLKSEQCVVCILNSVISVSSVNSAISVSSICGGANSISDGEKLSPSNIDLCERTSDICTADEMCLHLFAHISIRTFTT